MKKFKKKLINCSILKKIEGIRQISTRLELISIKDVLEVFADLQQDLSRICCCPGFRIFSVNMKSFKNFLRNL